MKMSVFYQGFYVFISCIQVVDIFLVDDVRQGVNLFACAYPAVQIPLMKRLYFLPWIDLDTLIENQCMGLFLCSSFSFIGFYMPIPMLTCHFDYCSFVVRFEIWKCETSNFILLSQERDYWGGPLQFYVNLRIRFSIS